MLRMGYCPPEPKAPINGSPSGVLERLFEALGEGARGLSLTFEIVPFRHGHWYGFAVRA